MGKFNCVSVDAGLLTQIGPDLFIIIADFCHLRVYLALDLVDVMDEVDDRFFECFESYEHFCLNFDSFFIVLLMPYFFMLIEVVNLLVEVGAWQLLAISQRFIIWLLVGRMSEVVRVGSCSR